MSHGFGSYLGNKQMLFEYPVSSSVFKNKSAHLIQPLLPNQWLKTHERATVYQRL